MVMKYQKKLINFFKAFNPESILINHFNELNKYEYFFDAVNFSEVIEHIPDENIGENY